MNRIARAIRAAAGELFRNIDAGGSGPRWRSDRITARPARDILARRQAAAQRAASLVLNSPTAAAIVDVWANSLVADGPSVRPATADAGLRREMTDAWRRWFDRCDAEGLSDFAGLLDRVARSLIVDGEAFAHFEVAGDGALEVRLWAASQVDPSIARELGEGRRIVGGIELDPSGKRAAFHVRDNPDVFGLAGYTARRVPAIDVAHVFAPIFAGQQRGMSWLAPAATRLAMLDEIEDAVLAKARTASLFAGVAHRPIGDAESPFGADSTASLEPGAILTVDPGWEVEFNDPPNSDGAIDLLKSTMRSIAAGTGVAYEQISADLSGTNYSSIRHGLQGHRRKVAAVRANILGAMFLRPLWRRWAMLEVLSGRLPAAAANVEATWMWPAWGELDPEKETAADAAAVAANLKSRAEIIAARGRDPEEVDAEIAADPRRPTTTEGTE